MKLSIKCKKLIMLISIVGIEQQDRSDKFYCGTVALCNHLIKLPSANFLSELQVFAVCVLSPLFVFHTVE